MEECLGRRDVIRVISGKYVHLTIAEGMFRDVADSIWTGRIDAIGLRRYIALAKERALVICLSCAQRRQLGRTKLAQ